MTDVTYDTDFLCTSRPSIFVYIYVYPPPDGAQQMRECYRHIIRYTHMRVPASCEGPSDQAHAAGVNEIFARRKRFLSATSERELGTR